MEVSPTRADSPDGAVVPIESAPPASELPSCGIGDVAAVGRLLGRPPQGEFAVVVRDADGGPVVIRNDPFLDDGRPMPTTYWLVGESERRAVSRLESAGGVGEAERTVGLTAVTEAHRRYAAEREAGIPPDHVGPRPSGGVGGTRRGVKCLHAHYAWHLAGGDDPVGCWVAARLAARAGDPSPSSPGVPSTSVAPR